MNRVVIELDGLKILVMGGTRFVGKALVSRLISKSNTLSMFTRGNNQVRPDVIHFKGDRHNLEDLKVLSGNKYDVIVDSSGRKLEDTQKVISVVGKPTYRLLYVSSAGVYSNQDFWPLDEDSPIDPKSRHLGKSETENWLIDQKIPFTSFRPTYIYGPGNYNPIEKWFFDRIIYKKSVPIPFESSIITQLGHVDDLASAMQKSLDYEVANNQIYNCSSTKGVTLMGLLRLAIEACGSSFNIEGISYFDHTKLDTKARKLFPLRLSHYLVDTTKIRNELNWEPKYDLLSGLKDSFINDYSLLKNEKPDFSIDQSLI